MPENTELKDYGRLLKDGELRIKAHDDQKIKVRYVCESLCLLAFM
jgi:guanine nucleotide exchange factor VAV